MLNRTIIGVQHEQEQYLEVVVNMNLVPAEPELCCLSAQQASYSAVAIVQVFLKMKELSLLNFQTGRLYSDVLHS